MSDCKIQMNYEDNRWLSQSITDYRKILQEFRSNIKEFDIDKPELGIFANDPYVLQQKSLYLSRMKEIKRHIRHLEKSLIIC